MALTKIFKMVCDNKLCLRSENLALSGDEESAKQEFSQAGWVHSDLDDGRYDFCEEACQEEYMEDVKGAR